jgi:hypothetical protein
MNGGIADTGICAFELEDGFDSSITKNYACCKKAVYNSSSDLDWAYTLTLLYCYHLSDDLRNLFHEGTSKAPTVSAGCSSGLKDAVSKSCGTGLNVNRRTLRLASLPLLSIEAP